MGSKLTLRVTAEADAEVGRRDFWLTTERGVYVGVFDIGALPEVREAEPNDHWRKPQDVNLPVLINGVIGAEDWDHFGFRDAAGETIVFDVSAARHGSRLDADLAILDERGNELAWVDDSTIFAGSHSETCSRACAGRVFQGRRFSVIHLFLTGGMSQMDTFDPKPDAKPEHRSQFKPISTSLPGVNFTEHLPRLAKLAHKFTVIRTMTHKTPVHVPACGLILSGHLPLRVSLIPVWVRCEQRTRAAQRIAGLLFSPGIDRLLGKRRLSGAAFQSLRRGQSEPAKFQVRDLEFPMGVDWARMDHRRSF